ncbi:type II secretion system F family protein [Candidatus Manganitrophus noduliformans]|uniref:Type II secretion system F family protein n=1 Tax=Candidatus Manganitrophus noduliformans TaxID=2606439 RepID=A0A7X6IBJ4_9BACT|nr:type II secretion system F family protein [Candidatus Manganitrophus noduliformans]NKE71541.1 type II secretion system F family protein [Candidatus Manganitrophus noduliformans]
MAFFSYRVAKGDGTIVTQQEEAESESLLRSRLEEQGYLVLSISKTIGLSLPTLSMQRRLPPRDFLVFNQELMALLKAGLPIMKIFDVLVDRGSQPGFVEALKAVQRDIRSGSAMSDAMAKHPGYFSDLYVSSLRAGEKSGNLVEVIGRFMDYQKKILEVKKKVVGALAYPSFLLAIGFGVLGFLLIYVMPSFTEIYEGSQVDLPLFTKVLLGLVHFIQGNLFLLSVAAAGLGALLWSLYQSGWGRAQADRLSLSFPFIKPIVRRHHLIRISRTLSTILKSGIPLVEAIRMVASAMTNRVVRDDVERAGEAVKTGIGISTALSQIDLFPKISIEMIAVGESTGSLEEMLNEVANFHEEELDLYLSRVTTWVEPVLLLTIGSLVAMILIAMYLPIFHLAGTIR